MNHPTPSEVWYVTGSQHLYGEQALRQVAANSQRIVSELNASGALPYPVVFKPIVTRPGVMTISSDGLVSAGDGAGGYAKIGLFQGTMTKNGDGSYRSADAAPVAGGGQNTKIQQGALETSNVSAINSMVDMINLNRSFELAQKSIQSEDSMTQTLTTVLS